VSTKFPIPFEPQNEEGNTWTPIPVGEYVAEAIEATVAPPKSGDGNVLKLTWKILEGDHEGRQVWHSIPFQHSNEQAQSIGRKIIKDICTALDINEAVQNAEVFLFKPVRIRVGIEKDKNGLYPDKNRVTRVLPYPDAAAGVAAAAGPAPKPGSPGGEGAPAEAAKAAAPAAPPAAPHTQGPARSGPAGSSPWHAKR